MSNRKSLVFIRHGESIANAGAITMPHASIPLSEYGRYQANDLATKLDVVPSAVLVSSMIRTRETAEPFCVRHAMAPQVSANLDEFSLVDEALLAGLDGAQRKPFVIDYWDSPDPHRRLGENADTFSEFENRVNLFVLEMANLPDATVIFGHGIWIALMVWRLLGYKANDTDSMRAFRRFQLGLPMPNCAVFTLTKADDSEWAIKANADLIQRRPKRLT